MNNDYSIILTTTNSENDAEILAEKLLETKLAACIQIQKIKSFYTWNEKIERSDEYLLLIKTRTELFTHISEFIKRNHTYEVPEIIQIPITNGSKEYLNWLEKSTACSKNCK